MKTTMEIPDPLFKQVKARAALEGLSLKDLVTHYLEAGLIQPVPPGNAPGTRPCPFPLIRGKGGPLLKRMSNEVIAQLEEEADLERVRRPVGR